MIGTFTRVSLVMAGLVALGGVAMARDAGEARQPRHSRAMQGFKPSYQANTNVAGPEQPYTWPVNDRYRPVSRPYFGRAY